MRQPTPCGPAVSCNQITGTRGLLCTVLCSPHRGARLVSGAPWGGPGGPGGRGVSGSQFQQTCYSGRRQLASLLASLCGWLIYERGSRQKAGGVGMRGHSNDLCVAEECQDQEGF